MISNEFSVLSDLSWSKHRKGTPIGVKLDPKFSHIHEEWKSDYPTRTDMHRADKVSDIIPIFGDSFMFCAGLPIQHELSTLLNAKYTDKLFVNIARPGSGNTRILTRLEQWVNDELSKKTKTIIIGFSSMYRFDYYMDTDNPNSISAHNSIYNLESHKILRAFDLMPQMNPKELYDTEKVEMQRKIQSNVSKVWAHMVEQETSYTNVWLRNVEPNIRRIDWITKAMNWDVIFVNNLSWHESIHPDDKNVFNKYLEDMDIPQRKFKIVNMWEENKSVEDRCDCGHWGVETIKNLTRLIQKEYDGI
jgi:hypothetical protein